MGGSRDYQGKKVHAKQTKMCPMGILPDTQKLWLRMRRECRERFPYYRIQRKPLVSDPGMHHGTCVTHVPWRMSGSLTRSGGENIPGIPGACATRNFAYLVRGPWTQKYNINSSSDESAPWLLQVTSTLEMAIWDEYCCSLKNKLWNH